MEAAGIEAASAENSGLAQCGTREFIPGKILPKAGSRQGIATGTESTIRNEVDASGSKAGATNCPKDVQQAGSLLPAGERGLAKMASGAGTPTGHTVGADAELQRLVARAMRASGVEPKNDVDCDLVAEVEGITWLFEVKSCRDGNLLDRVREGLSVLYEARYRHGQGKPDTKLCLVLQTAPVGALAWLVDYLEGDRGISVTWPTANGFRFRPEDSLSFLNHKGFTAEAPTIVRARKDRG